MTLLPSGPQRGRLCALGAATAFGILAPLAGLAYAGGASPGSVVAARLLFGLATAAAVMALRDRPWLPRRGTWLTTVLVAIAWLTLTVPYMASFYFIPVSLAVLIFFTFPVLISVIEPLVERRRPRWASILAAALAFLGLGLALGPGIGGLDWRGCGLAFLGSLGATATFILSRRLVVEQDLFAFSFHLHALCVGAMLLTFLALGGPALPVEALAWFGLLGVGVFYAVAVLLKFSAIRLAGPSRASVMFNAEPVVTMVGAGVILGEQLESWQVAGAVLVIGAVLWSTRIDPYSPN